ncbi:predicted protein [Nematostella vectensis]|uniref:Uncharacterized protein n=1 Tax=Nematostella vectensis TaxID=45351 RepID=A7RYN9_NEMVE|nr:predicted protein [Nematostella vectensis]|eukprot:XP_001635414.1 predicted protein [Nematostella vectensis]
MSLHALHLVVDIKTPRSSKHELDNPSSCCILALLLSPLWQKSFGVISFLQ